VKNIILTLVVQSKCPSLVGLKGIVIVETENTFKIVTTSNELKGRLNLFRSSGKLLTCVL